jgi:hypothetical protein
MTDHFAGYYFRDEWYAWSAPWNILWGPPGTGKTRLIGNRVSQPLAIAAKRYRPEAQALIQILDAIDQGVLGQRSLTVKELLAPGVRTLTGLGDVASLEDNNTGGFDVMVTLEPSP